ncbi:hypothetical protein LEP1GSC172_2921 [Leptospira noguchii]|uniref:Uncharacterized protein n=2 Tax=Leptospira noguchii TaxID=28182 RepID=T0FUH0_9LEPT|nr:hypothetical protein LEP1GSC172_2921 [Leptospira noguchii]EQA73924.1 hypothetical protein LEP1GSC059_4052 [Leptospira noguchii serovar Panama str. CZ214]
MIGELFVMNFIYEFLNFNYLEYYKIFSNTFISKKDNLARALKL